MGDLIQSIAGLVIRHGLGLIAGGLLARYGLAVDASQLDAIAGGSVAAGVVGWSVMQKLRARKA